MTETNRRTFGPLSADDWLVTLPEKCPGCRLNFVVGDITTLVAIGPGDSKEAQERCREGRPYNAVAVPVHAACAGVDVEGE